MHNLNNHPIAHSVRDAIQETLSVIETDHGVTVLFACESGSRGWGFASPDSDYDVRFIYVHPLPWYLRVSAQRDVIEMPITHELDMNGWDYARRLACSRKATLHWLNGWALLSCIGVMRSFFMQCRMPSGKHTKQSDRFITTCTWHAKTTEHTCVETSCV